MRLLLDTCTLLWLASGHARLLATGRAAISSAGAELFVSAISAFEIGLKHRKGRLDLGLEPERWWTTAVRQHGLSVLPVTDAIALASTALPPLHADPCDRIIVATAIQHGLVILTCDAAIQQYTAAANLW